MSRYTFSLAPKGDRLLAQIAATQEVSTVDAIRRSIGVMGILTETIERGGKILIVDASGEQREIVGI